MENLNSSNKKTLTLPFLVTRGLVVFPNLTESIEAARTYSTKAIDISRSESNSLIFVGVQKVLTKDEVTGEEDVFMTATGSHSSFQVLCSLLWDL